MSSNVYIDMARVEFIEDEEGFKKEVKDLLIEYTDMLIELDYGIKKFLDIQNYDDELDHIKEKYGRPYGRFYFIKVDKKIAGCIALLKKDDVSCELKRLYVRPEFRGYKLGEIMTQRIIDDAVEIGYEYILLDTLPYLKSAIHIYKKLGFYEIGKYNNSPMEISIFMRKDLTK